MRIDCGQVHLRCIMCFKTYSFWMIHKENNNDGGELTVDFPASIHYSVVNWVIDVISNVFPTYSRTHEEYTRYHILNRESWTSYGVFTVEWYRSKEVSDSFARPLFYLLLDQRLNHLPLMENPLVNTISVCIYIFIVKFAGPKFMENRKPFEFRGVLFVYNVGLVLLSAWMFYEVPFQMIMPPLQFVAWII